MSADFDRNYLPGLDGLRGLAAYMVVISHASNSSNLWGRLLGDGAGQVGVMIFFALSGFLMGWLYLGQTFTRASARRFVISRVARVIPLYVFIVLLSAFLIWNPGGLIPSFIRFYNISNFEYLFSHLFFIEGVNVLWTIPVEIQFYVLFLVFWGLSSVSRISAILYVAVIVFAVSIFDVWSIDNMSFVFKYLQFFAAGVCAAVLLRLDPGIFKERVANVAWLGMLVVLAGCYPQVYEMLFGVRHGNWIDPLLVVMAGLLVLFSAVSPLSQRVFGGLIGRFAGRISYSLYLWHMPVILILVRTTDLHLASPLAFVLLVAALSTLVAAVSYAVIEQPARRYVNQWRG